MNETNADALKLIQETAQEAQSAKVWELPGDGRTVHVQIGGALSEFVVPPPLRNHVVHSLADLVDYATGATCLSAVIWHGPDAVVVVCDDTDRRDRVVFPLSYSTQFTILFGLSKRSPTSDGHHQLALIRLLRLSLDVDETMVAKFRKLDWASGNTSKRHIEHSNAEIGNDVIAKCQGTDELPTTLNLEVPVYEQAGERQKYRVVCNVEIDPLNQLFYLKPVPGQIQAALDNAQADIRGRIGGQLKGITSIKVYYGSPEPATIVKED